LRLERFGENPAFDPTAVTPEHAVPVVKFGRQICRYRQSAGRL